MSFEKDKYEVVKKAVPKEVASFCYAYFLNKRQVAKHLKESGYISPFDETWGTWEDNQIPDTYSHYADLVMETLMVRVRPKMMEVTNMNLKCAYFITQAVAKKLIKCKKPGSLINISSQMGQVGGLERAVYSASKHAVEGFTKSMAIELGKYNIRVNTICPTFILTNLTKSSYKDKNIKKWIDYKIKLNRIGKVEDIMGAILFLASDASAMITGSALMIDGGWTAG